MLALSLRLDQLWAHDVSHAVSDEDRGCHEALLGVAGDVRHADCDDERHDGAEETDDAVTHDGRRGTVGPRALPDDCTAGNDRQAAQDQHDNADVREPRTQVTCEQDHDQADATKRELKEDRVERAPAKGRHNQGPKPRDCAIDGVAAYMLAKLRPQAF